MFPLLSRCVPWHRTQDRGSSPSPTHLEHFNFMRRVWRRKRRVGRGGRVIDRCGGGRGMQLQRRELYPLLYHRDSLYLVPTCPSSPTLRRCSCVSKPFLSSMHVERWMRHLTRCFNLIEIFGYYIQYFFLHLIDFIRKNFFRFRWTITETRIHLSYSFLSVHIFPYHVRIWYRIEPRDGYLRAAPTNADT